MSVCIDFVGGGKWVVWCHVKHEMCFGVKLTFAHARPHTHEGCTYNMFVIPLEL